MDATAVAVVIGAIAGLVTAATPLMIVAVRVHRRDDRRYAALERRMAAIEKLPCVDRDAAIDQELARLRDEIRRLKRTPSLTNER